MRRTLKYIKACEIIAGKYGQTTSRVLSNETNMDNVYAELRGDGYVWDGTSQSWAIQSSPKQTTEPAPALTRLWVKIRVMSDSGGDVAIAREYLVAMLREYGAMVENVSDVHQRRGENNARAYFEVGL